MAAILGNWSVLPLLAAPAPPQTEYMTSAGILLAAAVVAAGMWLTRRFVAIVKADGYGFRAASGLPRDWSPTSDLPSTSYVHKPHY